MFRPAGGADERPKLHGAGAAGHSERDKWALPLAYFCLPKSAKGIPLSPICQNSLLLRRPH